MYLYLKALHIVFVVTWFAGMFYMPRLFIYNKEAEQQPTIIKDALRLQFTAMMKRLWYGIAWPSAILTLILGLSVLFKGGWSAVLLQPAGRWLLVKLCFVLLLYAYQFSLHIIFTQQVKGIFKYSSQQLRILNEVATIFLIAIVMLASVKDSMSWAWGIIGLVLFIILLMSAIKIYKTLRQRNNNKD